ncbi:hypothetical protein DFR68_104362 [Nocardia mexicana]|uniref:Uncharacterized protein n=1 Tax=Nocardia mexicana TaxID=279262 RepID=A0A370HBB4_9NOCA|nr:hypothetical protein DFR68_104362 [Nocardia mexicana]
MRPPHGPNRRAARHLRGRLAERTGKWGRCRTARNSGRVHRSTSMPRVLATRATPARTRHRTPGHRHRIRGRSTTVSHVRRNRIADDTRSSRAQQELTTAQRHPRPPSGRIDRSVTSPSGLRHQPSTVAPTQPILPGSPCAAEVLGRRPCPHVIETRPCAEYAQSARFGHRRPIIRRVVHRRRHTLQSSMTRTNRSAEPQLPHPVPVLAPPTNACTWCVSMHGVRECALCRPVGGTPGERIALVGRVDQCCIDHHGSSVSDTGCLGTRGRAVPSPVIPVSSCRPYRTNQYPVRSATAANTSRGSILNPPYAPNSTTVRTNSDQPTASQTLRRVARRSASALLKTV